MDALRVTRLKEDLMSLRLGETSEWAVAALERQGINMWPSQSKQVVLPSDISSVDSDVLSNLFTRLTAWSDYVSTQLAAAQVDEKATEKKLDFATNKLLVSRSNNSTKGERVTMIKAEIALDPVIVKLEEEYMKAYAYRKMVESVSSNLDRDISLISREITRRSNNSTGFRRDKFSV